MITLKDITGLAATIDTAKAEVIDTLAREYDRDAVFSSLIKKLDNKYTLFYADYRDQFDPETIAKFINAHNPEILEEQIDEWFMDARFEAAVNIMKETYDNDEKAAIELLDLSDEIRYAIEERDDSSPIRDLLKNSQSHFCYVDILPAEEDGCLESYLYVKNALLEYKKIAKASGLSLKKDRKGIEELYHNGASTSIAPLVWFFVLDPLDYYNALMKQYKETIEDIRVTLHEPHLAIRDHCHGTGHDIETKRIVTVPLSSIKSDEKSNGYSYAKDVCGLVRAPYEIGFTF